MMLCSPRAELLVPSSLVIQQAKAYSELRHREFSWTIGGIDRKRYLKRSKTNFPRCSYGEQSGTKLSFLGTLIVNSGPV